MVYFYGVVRSIPTQRASSGLGTDGNNGISTRKGTPITEELCGTEFSKSTVSELCKRLNPVVNAWTNRSLLRDAHYPFAIVDALVLKVREEGRVCARGVMVVYGVNTDGYREILDLILGDSESSDLE